MKKITKKRINEIKTKYTGFIFNEKIINEIKNSITDIQKYIEQSNYLKNAYFWNPPSNASARRDYENKYSRKLQINFFNESYSLEIKVDCSCQYIYVSKSMSFNEIKTLLKNVQEIIYVLTFDQYKTIIVSIDSLIETNRSVNDNDTLFSKEYYLKNVGNTFLENYTKVNLSKTDKQRLEELRLKRYKEAA